MKKTFIKILCVLFAFIFSCVNATATEIAVDIKEELTEAFGFPLHFESSYSDETLNAQISLREEFSEVEEYELNVRHWLLGGTILYEKVSGDEIIELYDIDFGHNYSITLTLYYPDRIKYIDGTFAAELSEDGVVFEFEHEQIDDIVNYYNYLDESAEMTDEEYDEVFEYLDIPSFIEKEKAKEFKHLVRIEEFKDSLTTIGFYNSDGTTTVYTFSDPVRYVDTDGTIKDYSADIVPAVESVEQQGYKYSNKFGEMTVNFSDQLSNSSGTEIISKHGTIEFGLFGAQQKQEQTVIDKLFDADINEATLTKDGTAQKIEYEGIGIDGVTIKSEPVIDGAKTSIIMSEVPQDNKIRIWVSTQNLLPIVDDRGRFVNFVDAKTNSILYRFGYVETRDNGNSNNRRFTTNNSVCIVGQNASKVLIEISLDNDFVYSPVVSYPISTDVYLISTEGQYIDYSSETAKNTTAISNRTAASISDINVTSTEASSVYATTSAPPPTDDGYYVTCYYTKETSNIKDISIHSNGNVDAWDSAWLNTGRVTSYWTGTACVNVVSSIVMQYDSTSIEELDVDVDKIKFAEISFYGANSGIEDFTVPVKIERLTESWNESYVNSSLRNKVDTEYIGNESDEIYRNEGEGRLTVTEFVKDHLRYIEDESTGIPNYGIRVVTVDNDAPLLFFASKDHPDASKRPKLLITYEGYVFTPYENNTTTIRIKSNESYVKLDYGKQYISLIENLVLLTKNGARETANVDLSFKSHHEDIATVDTFGNVTALQTKGTAIIEVKRLDTKDSTYIFFDVSQHIEIAKGVSQAVLAENDDNDDIEYVLDDPDDSYPDIDLVISINEKEWDYIQYDLLEGDDLLYKDAKENANIKADCNYQKDFSPEELKYLFKLDPNGVLHYVYKTSLNQPNGLNRNEEIFNQVKYKDEVFKAIFERAPLVYSRENDGTYKRIVGAITAENVEYRCSESEFLFGIVNRYEWSDYFRYASQIIGTIALAGTCISVSLSVLYSLEATAYLSFATLAVDVVSTILSLEVVLKTDDLTVDDIVNLASNALSLAIGTIQCSKTLKVLLTNWQKNGTLYAYTYRGIVKVNGGTEIQYIPSSGVRIISNPDKTTTIIGRFEGDISSIIKELQIEKSLDFSGNLGGFNILNVPDELYVDAHQFWLEYNKSWLDAAIQRGDDIILATKPTHLNLYNNDVLTGFGREFQYLQSCGYRYCEELQRMIKL